LTLSPSEYPKLAALKEVAIHRIGTITAESGMKLRLSDGSTIPLLAKGFDHL
jgi:thiamine monophosphate kinase